jgi:hypothetical protein
MATGLIPRYRDSEGAVIQRRTRLTGYLSWRAGQDSTWYTGRCTFRACSLEWPDSDIDRPVRCRRVVLPSDEIGDHPHPPEKEAAPTFEGTIAQLGSGARSLGPNWDACGP